jgi:hypothetical protein
MADKIVNPVILTSILPFGLNDDGTAFRFSLCIDLLSDYPEDLTDKTFPNPYNLQKFFLNYSKIVKEIRKGFWILIDDEPDIEVHPCFDKFFNSPDIYWKLFLPQHEVESLSAYLSNTSGLVQAQNLLSSASIIKKVMPLIVEKKPNTVLTDLVAMNQDLKENSKSFNEALEKISASYIRLDETIEKTKTLIAGIHEYANQQNLIHNNYYINRRTFGIGDDNMKLYSTPDNILNFFSFVSSNPILQRFFNTTIDFEIPIEILQNIINIDIVENKLVYKEFSIRISKKSEFDSLLTTDGKPLLSWQYLVSRMEYGCIQENRTKSIKEVILMSRKNELKESSESFTKPWLTEHFSTANYDFGSKLKSLTTLKDKLEVLQKKFNDTKTESDRYNYYKEFITLDATAFTRGMNLYNFNVDEEINNALGKLNLKPEIQQETISYNNVDSNLFEKDIIRGFRFGAIINANGDINSLGSRKINVEDLNNNPIQIPDIFKTQEFSVHTDTGIHALIPDITNANKITPTVLVDTAILTWSGENIGMPSIFSNKEDETNFQPNQLEGSVSSSVDVVSRFFMEIFKEEYFPSGVKYHGSIANNNTTVKLNKKINDETVELKNKNITIKYSYDKNVKLILGNEYGICKVPEYKNGWGPSFNSTLYKTNPNKQHYELGYYDIFNSHANFSIRFTFKRNEPVKPVQFFLQDQLIENYIEKIEGKNIERQRAITGREGESLHHLVIRNYNKDDDKTYETHQKSVRHILPPAISFEHAFWHNKIFEMDTDHSYNWYKRYHFPVFEKNPIKDKNGDDTGRKYTVEDSIEGSTRMRDFYPDNDKWYIPDRWEHDDIINYLPDPLSKGFRLEFFLDKNKTKKAKEYEKYEENEYYFSGDYPKINAWRIVVTDIDDELLSVENEKIFIRINKGHELFIVARTILDETYESQFETYGNYNDFTKYGNNDLLTPALEFSIVHATQRPLVVPKFNNTLFSKKEFGKTFLTLINTINIEQLDIYETDEGIIKYIEETIPTGKIELYAKWENFIDDPKHLITEEDSWTPNEPVNKIDKEHFYKNKKEGEDAILETDISITNDNLMLMQGALNKIGNESNPSANYSTDIKVRYDVRETKFIEKWLWIKNKSKFTSYFPGNWGNEDASKLVTTDHESHKDYFNKTSKEAFLIKILSNRKPNKPQLANRNITLVSVIEDHKDRDSILRKSSLNRLRFYFERGRFSSGKGERIGFVLNEPDNKYNDFLVANNLVSITGKDIVTDSAKPYDGLHRNDAVLLQKSNFVTHDPYDLKDENGNAATDVENFEPKYVKELGLITYVPQLNKNLNLWYLDVELDINDENGKELHNPFLQFALVNYQEHSWDYNEEISTKDISKDCRLSEIEKSGFVYIMGSRTIYVEPSKGSVSVSLGCDHATIISQSKLKTDFYAFIQTKPNNSVKWEAQKVDGKTIKPMPLVSLDANHGSQTIIYEAGSGDYRLVILESEYRYNNDSFEVDNLSSLLEDKNRRIIMVNFFNL